MEFTKQIKEDWLKALKSGEYTQTKVTLKRDNKHCCIGVLGEIHPDLEPKAGGDACPYNFLDRTIGDKEKTKLYRANDSTFNSRKPDYSNVIPLIEQLKTAD